MDIEQTNEHHSIHCLNTNLSKGLHWGMSLKAVYCSECSFLLAKLKLSVQAGKLSTFISESKGDFPRR
jgi:hypothetical protein